MRSKLALSAVLIFVSGCAGMQTEATDKEKAVAIQEFKDCEKREYPYFEDHISPADQIALGLEKACSKEISKMYTVFTQGMSSYAADIFGKSFYGRMNDDITAEVLLLRAGGKKGKEDSVKTCTNYNELMRAVRPSLQCMVDQYISIGSSTKAEREIADLIIAKCKEQLSDSEIQAKELTVNCSDLVKNEYSDFEAKVFQWVHMRRGKAE